MPKADEGTPSTRGLRTKRRVAVGLAVCASLLAMPATATAHPGHGPGGSSAPPDAAAAGPDYGSGWKPETPIAGGPRQEHSVTALGRDVYVLGGIVPNPAGGFTTTNRVEVYDTKRGTWSTAAPMPVAMNHPNVAAVDGKIYVIGGLDGGASWEAIPDSFVYNPRANEWTRLRSMPAGEARGSAAVGARGTKIYLAGGMRTLTPGPGGLQETVASASSYDVVTQTWKDLPDLPQARDHVGGAVVKGTFYVLGGRDRGQVNVRDTVYALDLRTQRWAERSPMPTPRGGIATAVVGTTIYTFGGEGNPAAGSHSVYDDTEAYDTTTDRWRQLAPMPVPRHGTAAATVGRVIYIPGGGDAGGGAPVDANDSYRPRPHNGS